jgi:hypothetical protein
MDLSMNTQSRLVRTIVLATVITSACTFKAEPADSLADAIIESARPLLDKPDGAQITLEHKIEPNEPFVVALLPDDADALTAVHGMSKRTYDCWSRFTSAGRRDLQRFSFWSANVGAVLTI